MIANARMKLYGLLLILEDCVAKDKDALGDFRNVCRKNNMYCAESSSEES